LFPQDEDSDPETEQYLPPPSSSTKVATVIRARIRRYFDDQAEDSDEDADEEREEEEQEMEEDRGMVSQSYVLFIQLTVRGFQILWTTQLWTRTSSIVCPATETTPVK
jgi:ABC-type polar amino acid transport system ATPase subunit